MAKSMWGKQPPKKQAYTPPELGTPSFWGPAPVPPKVYQVWDDIRGEGRDGTPYEDPEGIAEGGAHDSWVSKFSKRFAIDPVVISGETREGTSRDTEGRMSSADPVVIAGEGRDGTSPETEGGDDGDGGSFATGEGEPADIEPVQFGTGEGEPAEIDPVVIAGEGRDGTSPETEGRTSVANPFDVRGEGRDDTELADPEGLALGGADSWVSGFEKELATSTSGSGDPTVREQGGSAHDSWVSQFSQQMTSSPFTVSGDGADGSFVASPITKPPIQPISAILGTGRDGTPLPGSQGLDPKLEHDSWVSAFKKELTKSQGTSWRAPVPASPVIPSSGITSGAVSREPAPTDKFVGQWNFRVSINGIPDDNCKLLSISGLSSETEPIEFKRSTRQYVEAIPGKYKYSNVELTKVMNLGGDSFARWREEIEAGANAMRTVTVYLHHIDLKGDPVMVLTLHDAWPLKWEFPELSGSSSDAAIEKVTLHVGRITRG